MQRLSRRRVLALSGTAIAGGIGFTQLTSKAEAQSDVSYGSFGLSDTTYYGTSPSDIVLEVTAKYSYTANRPPTKWMLKLKVGTTTSSLTEIASKEKSGEMPTSEENTQPLSGSLLDAADYDLETNFTVEKGNTKQTKVWAELVFEVHDTQGMVTNSSVITDAIITISGEELTVDTELGATGGMTVHRTPV